MSRTSTVHICNPPQTWYCVRLSPYFTAPCPVSVLQYSDSSVYLDDTGGSRRNRISQYDCYFPTMEEALRHYLQWSDQKGTEAQIIVDRWHDLRRSILKVLEPAA